MRGELGRDKALLGASLILLLFLLFAVLFSVVRAYLMRSERYVQERSKGLVSECVCAS